MCGPTTLFSLSTSVYFLDILAITLKHTHCPLQVFQYDGRKSASGRHILLEEFKVGHGCRVLLASRGTGGEGLNIQCANVLLRCGPWWKASWDIQA